MINLKFYVIVNCNLVIKHVNLKDAKFQNYKRPTVVETMQFKVGGMDQIDNDPSSSRIVSPEEAEEVGGLLPDVVLVAEGSAEEVEDEGDEVQLPEELEEDEFGNHGTQNKYNSWFEVD